MLASWNTHSYIIAVLELNNRTGESATHPTPKVATIVLSSTTLPVPLVGYLTITQRIVQLYD